MRRPLRYATSNLSRQSILKSASLFIGVVMIVVQASLRGCGSLHNKRAEKTVAKKVKLTPDKEEMKTQISSLLKGCSCSDTIKLMESDGFVCRPGTDEAGPYLHCSLVRPSQGSRWVSESYWMNIRFKNNLFESVKVMHGYTGL